MTKKTKQIAKKDNDNDIIPEETMEKIFTDLVSKDTNAKQSKFFLYWLFGYPVKTCAKKAGYKESYGYKLVAKYEKVPKVRQRVDEILNMFPDRYRAVCKMRLPDVAEIEGAAIKEYKKKPRLAVDKPQLLKTIKQAGGVDLSEKDTPPATTINIKSIERVQIATTEMLEKRLKKLTE